MVVFIAFARHPEEMPRQQTEVLGVFESEKSAQRAVSDHISEFSLRTDQAWTESHDVQSGYQTPDWMEHPREEVA
jgi:hypothetical protein